jgi:hypothetical protein
MGAYSFIQSAKVSTTLPVLFAAVTACFALSGTTDSAPTASKPPPVAMRIFFLVLLVGGFGMARLERYRDWGSRNRR